MSMMARDLGVNAVQLSHALDVGQSTAYRWLAHNSAPRTALLAVFWLTTWGRSTLDAEAHNRANVYQGLAEAFERELWRQQQDFARLANIGHYGSANDPLRHFAPVFGLDGADTFRAIPGAELASISQDTQRALRFDRQRR